MTLKIKREIIEELMMKFSPWKIDINFFLKKKLDLRWKEGLDLIEEWMRLLNVENRLKI